MAKFTWVVADGWQGLYRDANLVLEGHTLHPLDFARELGIEIRNFDPAVDEALMELGSLPQRLEDLDE